MSFGIDVNILLYASDESSPLHDKAAEFLSRCASGKAHLAPDAWKSPDVTVFRFEAEVFGEKDFAGE